MARPLHRLPPPEHRQQQHLSSQPYRARSRSERPPRGAGGRVIPVVNRSPSAKSKSPGVVPRSHRSAARAKATGPLLRAIAGCRLAVVAPAQPPGDASRRLRGRLTADATLPVFARQRLPWPRPYYRDGYPAAACLAGHAQSGPGAVAAPLELEQARAGSAGGHPRRERTYLGAACRL
jgi:hypothetical protein